MVCQILTFQLTFAGTTAREVQAVNFELCAKSSLISYRQDKKVSVKPEGELQVAGAAATNDVLAGFCRDTSDDGKLLT